MNILKGVALGLALVAGSASSALALKYRPDLNQVLEGGKEFDATVTDVIVSDDSDGLGARTYFEADTSAGPSTYAIDPDYDLAKKYELGKVIEQGFLVHTDKVVIDGRHLKTGRITSISPYVATVVLDNGDIEQLYLDDVRRRRITLGDQVVITSCTKWFVRYDYQLRPADLRPVYEAKIEYPPIPVPPAPPAPPPVAPPPPAPVPALW